MEFWWCHWAAGLSIWNGPPLESAVIQWHSTLFGPVWAKFYVTLKNQVFWELKQMKKKKENRFTDSNITIIIWVKEWDIKFLSEVTCCKEKETKL